MDKKTVNVIIFSVFVVISWVVYTVYSNLFVGNPNSSDANSYSKYTNPITNQMYISAFTKLTSKKSNVQVNLATLQPSPTIIPTPSVTLTPTVAR